MKSNTQGFTLLELLVVIVLMVMAISVTSVSIVSGQDGARMKTSARQLVSVLRSARTRAITEGIEAGITLGAQGLGPDDRDSESRDSNNKTFVDRDKQDKDLENLGRSYTIVPSNETIVLPGELSLSLNSGAQRGIVPAASVLFYPDGSSSGGSLVLSAPSGKMTIDINWLTGEVVLDKAFASSLDVAQTAAMP